MINKKMLGLGQNRSAIRDLFEYGRKRKEEIGAESVFDFSLGNPDLPAPECVNNSIIELVNNTDSKSLHGYTSAIGDLQTRAAIARNLEERYDVSLDESLIYLTVGAAASLVSALSAVTNPGDEVIVLAPYFPEYKVFIERTGAVVREVKCCEGTLLPDIQAISNVINEKTAAIIINTPNNPTGAVYGEKCISAIAKMLGIGRASLYRAFEKLESDGLIIKNNKEIILKEALL